MKKLRKPIFEITPRTDVPTPGIWYNLKIGKREYSLMDCGALMKTCPIKGIFMGWETLRTVNGEQEIIRADTLIDLLIKLN